MGVIRSVVALLHVEALTVRRGTQNVLENFNMKIESSNCIILTGENGSGKSTLLESIAGIIPVQSGKVTIKHPFGLALQSGGFNGDELVEERLEYAAQASGVNGTDGLLNHWNLEHRRHDKIGQLSGGLCRRLAVIQGMMPAYGSEPRICLLDEPSEGLDDASVDRLRADIATLRERGHAFLIATHDPRLHDCATIMMDLEGVTNEVDSTIESTNAGDSSDQLLETEAVIEVSEEQVEKSSEETDEDELLAAMIAEEEASAVENITDSEDDPEAERTLTAEEELLLLEDENLDDPAEEEGLGTDLSEVPEDIWSIHRAGSGQEGVGAIRFAEDIEDLRGVITARKGRKTSNQSSANRSNRRNRPARRRR